MAVQFRPSKKAGIFFQVGKGANIGKKTAQYLSSQHSQSLAITISRWKKRERKERKKEERGWLSQGGLG